MSGGFRDGAAEIWVIDDSVTSRLYMERLLSPKYRVMLFEDGPSALVALETLAPPDLIVLDWEMPMMTGTEVCRFVRAQHDQIELPVLMVTGNTETTAAHEALAEGANDIVRRPFDPVELLARIKNLIRLESLAQHRASSLRAVFAQVPAAVAHLRGPQHVYDMANAAYLEMVENSDVLGRDFRDVLSVHADQSILAQLDRAYATGAAFSASDVLVAVEGGPSGRRSELYFDFTYQPTRDHSGKVDGIFVHAVDVTDGVHAQQRARFDADELARSERWLSTLLASIDDAVISTDLERRIVFANPVAEDLTGWTAVEMRGRLLDSVVHVVHETTRGIVTSPIEAVLRDGRVAHLAFHTVLVRRDGTEIAIEDSAAPIRGGDGVITGAVLVFRDVRERALADRDRRQRTRELELNVAVSAALATANPLDVQLQACADAVVRNLDAAFARVWTLSATHDVLELRASMGLYTSLDDERARVTVGTGRLGQIAADGRPHVTNDASDDPDISDPAWAKREKIRGFAGLPIIIDGRVIGVMAMFSRSEISEDTLKLLASVANQLAIGIERANVTSERERLLDLTDLARRGAEAQREQLSALFEQAPVAIAVLRGASHIVELANPHVRDLWARDEAQLIGIPLFDALPEIRGQGLEALLSGVLTTGVAYTGTELPVPLARGLDGQVEIVYFNFVYQPMRGSTGTIDAVLVVATDVTEGVLARREAARLADVVREREERLRLALEASEAGAWELDLATGIVHGDPIVRALYQLPSDQEVSLAAGLVKIHRDDAKRVEQSIERALLGANGGAFREEYRLEAAGGGTTWILSRGQAHFDDAGIARRFVGTLLDVTDRKQAESLREALLKSEKQRREAAEKQRDFEQYIIGVVSHDLRTPMQAIMMGTELLLNDHPDDGATSTLVRVQRNADRATRLIRDVLDFTQARLGGGFALNLASADLGRIASEMVDELRSMTPSREISLRVTGDSSGVWDADRVAQVVSNLVSNALKYSAANSTITVSVHGTAHCVELSVHNVGPVIPANRIRGLFSPMQRHSASQANPHRSVGLGLYIVDQIVDGHRGVIRVTSTEAAGTTFQVCWPRVPPPLGPSVTLAPDATFAT